MTRPSKRTPEFMDEIVLSRHTDTQIAFDHGVTRGYVTQLRKSLRSLVVPPKVVDGKVLCSKCGDRASLVLHRGQLVCATCNRNLAQVEQPHSAVSTEWQDGFTELYLFFRDVMQGSDTILTEEGQDSWNALLAKRNKPLISKLGKEVKTHV